MDNTWVAEDKGSGIKFPRLDETISTITDLGYPAYTHRTTYHYDSRLNVDEEHKYGMTSEEEIHTYFVYTNFTTPWILSKPTDIMVKNSGYQIVSRQEHSRFKGFEEDFAASFLCGHLLVLFLKSSDLS